MTRVALLLPGGLAAEQCLDAAGQAERAGLDGVWVTENLFTRGGFGLAGAVAAVTSRIRVGVGTVSPLTRHPAVLAMEAAAVAEISAGRFALGLGVGPAARLDQVGASAARPVAAMTDALRVTRALLAGETVTDDGSFPTRDVGLDPQATSALPLYLGAGGPRMLALAGARADGVLLSLLTPLPLVERAVTTVAASAREAGRQPADVPVAAYVPLGVDDADPERAVASTRRFLADNIARFAGNPALETMLLSAPSMTRERLDAVARAPRDADSDLLPDALVREYAVVGDVEAAARTASTWLDLGVAELVFAPCGDGAAVEAAIAAVGRLASRLRTAGR